MNATQTTTELVNLSFEEWEGSRSAQLAAVPRSTTVGQAAAEAVRALQLPFHSFWRVLRDGREVSHADTLDEAGVKDDDRLSLIPEVAAG